MKKVVIFGGGTGLSCILSGLKLFPIDVTTVIAVSDNGSSTGKLKEELNISIGRSNSQNEIFLISLILTFKVIVDSPCVK